MEDSRAPKVSRVRKDNQSRFAIQSNKDNQPVQVNHPYRDTQVPQVNQ
jgi:hypothetical protein